MERVFAKAIHSRNYSKQSSVNFLEGGWDTIV